MPNTTVDLFDLVLHGGNVCDPGAARTGRFDVGIRGDRVVAIEPEIPSWSSRRMIDATGTYVVPGLIDLHSHVYWMAGKHSVRADSVGSRTGVTTWVDAGSAGALTLPGLWEYVGRSSMVRILSLLNISSIGLAPLDFELSVIGFCDVGLFKVVADAYSDFVVGVKIRMGASNVGPHGIEPLRRARSAAEATNLPLFVHIAEEPPRLPAILELLRPGDVVSHCCTGQSMGVLNSKGELRPEVRAARESGIQFDLGHGQGSFSWSVAQRLMDLGFPPDTLSTDTHQLSLRGPMFDLPTCMSKMMAVGMSFHDVVEATTSRPASWLRREGQIGTLAPGAFADVTLLKIESGDFPLYDSDLVERKASRLVHSVLTVAGGRVLERLPPDPEATWLKWARVERDQTLMLFQDELLRMGHTPEAMVRRQVGVAG